ncbi:TetR/AcrR family transcriptional regulator C-terminal domain-containing protein [Nocardia colli]|uniref:TetR/AcrR family transcriptional regulator C-terminal domain-containing protein n=1 Tax=Nocardia colli TaxID=2545717 RepID=UPI0035D5BA10
MTRCCCRPWVSSPIPPRPATGRTGCARPRKACGRRCWRIRTARASRSARTCCAPSHSARSSTQTVRVLHAAGFDLADASRAADTLLGLVLGAAVERQSAPAWDAAQGEQARTQFPTTIAGFEARRQQGDDALRSFRYSIDILIHGLVALRQESHSAR